MKTSKFGGGFLVQCKVRVLDVDNNNQLRNLWDERSLWIIDAPSPDGFRGSETPWKFEDSTAIFDKKYRSIFSGETDVKKERVENPLQVFTWFKDVIPNGNEPNGNSGIEKKRI